MIHMSYRIKSKASFHLFLVTEKSSTRSFIEQNESTSTTKKAERDPFWSRSASYNQLIYQSFLMLLGFL